MDITYTDEMVQEIRKCLNPIYFIENYVLIPNPHRGMGPFKLYSCQNYLVRSYHHFTNNIVLQSRQCGVTISSVAYLMHYAMFTPDVTVFLGSNNDMSAMDLMSKAQLMYENLPEWLRPSLTQKRRHSLKFDNGSSIWSRKTCFSSVKGCSLSAMYLDNFGYVKRYDAEEFWMAVEPSLATGTKTIISSSGNMDISSPFRQIWQGAIEKRNGFNPIQIDWWSVPGRNLEFKKEQIQIMGKDNWDQEFGCKI